jgi:CxxC motif-containing protein
MIKKITCIECPKGCRLTVSTEEGRVISVSGNQCEKGAVYAHAEIENPVRYLTSAVLTQGLQLKMAPVRTDKPIPRERVFEGMALIKKIRLHKRLKAGESVVKDFLNLGVNLIVTRDVC